MTRDTYAKIIGNFGKIVYRELSLRILRGWPDTKAREIRGHNK